MDTDGFFGGLERLFADNRISEVERYLTRALSEAEYESDREAMLAIYNELISFHVTMGEYEKALYFCRQIMRLADKMDMADTVSYGTTLMNVAKANCAAGNLLEALAYYRKVKDIYDGQISPYDVRFAVYYNNIAQVYQELGDYDRAVTALEDALRIIERHENAGREIVTTYANLGESLLRAGRIDEAEDRLREAVRRYQLKGEHGEHYSAALAALAEVYYRQGNLKDAQKFYELAAAELYDVYGDSDAYRVILNNLDTVKAKLLQ